MLQEGKELYCGFLHKGLFLLHTRNYTVKQENYRYKSILKF